MLKIQKLTLWIIRVTMGHGVLEKSFPWIEVLKTFKLGSFYWFPGKAGSRIRDQLKIYQINFPYVTQGFLEKPNQGSRIMILDPAFAGNRLLLRLLLFNTISFYVYNLLLLLLLLLLCFHVSMFTPSSNKALPIKLSCLREISLGDRIL